MKDFKTNLLSLLKRRDELSRGDFWHAFNDVDYETEHSQIKAKVLDFTSFVYLPYCRQWHGQELKRNYEEAFLDLLEDFLADDSLAKFEDSKLYPKFKAVQDIIAEDVKKRPWMYYNTDS